MRMLRNRAIAISFALALIAVAFGGLLFVGADEHLPADLTVTVMDNFGADDDMMTYAGDDVYFNLTGWGAINGSADYTVQISINEGTAVDMMYDADHDYYYWTLEDAPVGDHTWNVSVMNDTDMDELWKTGSLMVYEMPSYTGTGTATIGEDMMVQWDLRDDFGPDGVVVSIDNETELEALGWTITPDPENATVWNITPPMNIADTYEFHFTATTAYASMMIEQMVMVTVTPVNDWPMIEYIMYDEMEHPIVEMYNYTYYDEDLEENVTEFRDIINLSMDEDGELMFMVAAMDYETIAWNLTYTIDEMSAPVMIENDLNETNATIPYNFTMMGDPDANGMYWMTLNVTDDPDDGYDMIWLWLTIEAVNDAPMGEFEAGLQDRYERLTEEAINVSVTVSDVDSEDLTVMWYINGNVVPGWNELYFLYNWTEEGLYNISAKVTDGELTYDIGYFHVNVTLANTAPVITSVEVTPIGVDLFDAVDWITNREIEEGIDVKLACVATDPDGDDLTYTWTVDTDVTWTMTGATVTVPADWFEKDMSYTFTCTVSDGVLEVSDSDDAINIVEEEDETEGLLAACGGALAIIIGVPILIIILIIILVIVMKKKGKKEEPEFSAGEDMPSEEGEMPSEEGEMPIEGEMPSEEGEMPIEGEMPPEQPPMEGYEQPVAEEPMAAPEEPVPEQPAPPVPPQYPEQG